MVSSMILRDNVKQQQRLRSWLSTVRHRRPPPANSDRSCVGARRKRAVSAPKAARFLINGPCGSGKSKLAMAAPPLEDFAFVVRFSAGDIDERDMRRIRCISPCVGRPNPAIVIDDLDATHPPNGLEEALQAVDFRVPIILVGIGNAGSRMNPDTKIVLRPCSHRDCVSMLCDDDDDRRRVASNASSDITHARNCIRLNVAPDKDASGACGTGDAAASTVLGHANPPKACPMPPLEASVGVLADHIGGVDVLSNNGLQLMLDTASEDNIAQWAENTSLVDAWRRKMSSTDVAVVSALSVRTCGTMGANVSSSHRAPPPSSPLPSWWTTRTGATPRSAMDRFHALVVNRGQ